MSPLLGYLKSEQESFLKFLLLLQVPEICARFQASSKVSGNPLNWSAPDHSKFAIQNVS